MTSYVPRLLPKDEIYGWQLLHQIFNNVLRGLSRRSEIDGLPRGSCDPRVLNSTFWTHSLMLARRSAAPTDTHSIRSDVRLTRPVLLRSSPPWRKLSQRRVMSHHFETQSWMPARRTRAPMNKYALFFSARLFCKFLHRRASTVNSVCTRIDHWVLNFNFWAYAVALAQRTTALIDTTCTTSDGGPAFLRFSPPSREPCQQCLY